MIIVLKPGSSDADIEDVSRRVGEMGFKPDRFATLTAELRPLAKLLGRSL